MKKILGAIVMSVFVGLPFFAMATDPCASASAFYTPPGCATGAQAQDNIQVAPAGAASDNIQVGAPASLSVNTKIQNPIKYETFSEFVAAVTKTAVQVLMPFIVLAFIYSGFLFVKAQGNDTELTNAKNVLWYSVLGAFILLGAWGFAQIIGQTVSTITQ